MNFILNSLNVNCYDIIDSNWLSTIDSIVISVIIFLLGAPLLLFQTYLPESIKEVYNRRIPIVNDLLFVGFLTLFGLTIIFYYGNHGVKYDILLRHFQYEPSDSLVHKNGVCSISEICCFYNNGILFLLIFIFISAGYFFYKIYASRGFKEKLIEKITTEAIQKKYFMEEDMPNRLAITNDLSVLGKSFELPVDKDNLLLGINKIVTDCLKNENYQTDWLDDIFNKTLFETICSSSRNCSRSNYRNALKIVKNVVINSKNDSFDKNAIIGLIQNLAIGIKDCGYESEYNDCVNILLGIESARKVCFYLAKEAWQSGNNNIIVQQIFEIRRILYSDQNWSNNSHINNLIAYLAWVYDESELGKYFVVDFIQVKMKGYGISNRMLGEAENYFISTNIDFKTASMISKMKPNIITHN